MKKTNTMRVAVVLLALALVTSCFVGGTFAKYISNIGGTDNARVAYWGFGKGASITIDSLFTYEDLGVKGNSNVDGLIAPGTASSEGFAFNWKAPEGVGAIDGVVAPEVDYKITVTATGTCDDAIKDNENIVWKLDDTAAPEVMEGGVVKYAEGSFDALLEAIKGLSGDVSGVASYEAGNLPVAFNGTTIHTVGWAWEFSTDETHDKDVDTVMGNSDTALDVSITISVTAEQLDTYTAPVNP